MWRTSVSIILAGAAFGDICTVYIEPSGRISFLRKKSCLSVIRGALFLGIAFPLPLCFSPLDNKDFLSPFSNFMV